MKKYLVRPTTVRSKHDGDTHYIGAKQLMDLHRVNPRECIVLHDGPLPWCWDTEEKRKADGLTLLTPDYRGNYGDIG